MQDDSPRGSFPEVLLAFLRLGLTSFGGPVAHLGYFRQEFVERRKWLDETTYSDIVALCQFLPGPASSQVGISLGIRRAGLPGGLAAAVHARLTVRHAAYALTSWGVLCRLGWWKRTLTMVRYARIQTVALCESPFDRRHGMASVRIDTAGAAAGGYTIRIPYLNRDAAAAVSRRLHDEAARQPFRW